MWWIVPLPGRGTVGVSARQMSMILARSWPGALSRRRSPPGVRSSPAMTLYLAYLRDPDGNKLNAFVMG